MTQHERHLHKDRKKALAVLFMQVLVIIGYIACLAANVQKFSAVGLALMFLLIAILLILSFIGFNAIFYLDQGKLGLFKFLNIIAIILFVAFHIIMLLFMKSDDYVSEYGDDYAGEFIISSVILTVIVLLDILMISLIRSLSTKWRRASEKSQIKSAVFDRMSYENILQTSLLLENNDAKKSRYSNTGK